MKNVFYFILILILSVRCHTCISNQHTIKSVYKDASVVALNDFKNYGELVTEVKRLIHLPKYESYENDHIFLFEQHNGNLIPLSLGREWCAENTSCCYIKSKNVVTVDEKESINLKEYEQFVFNNGVNRNLSDHPTKALIFLEYDQEYPIKNFEQELMKLDVIRQKIRAKGSELLYHKKISELTKEEYSQLIKRRLPCRIEVTEKLANKNIFEEEVVLPIL